MIKDTADEFAHRPLKQIGSKHRCSYKINKPTLETDVLEKQKRKTEPRNIQMELSVQKVITAPPFPL